MLCSCLTWGLSVLVHASLPPPDPPGVVLCGFGKMFSLAYSGISIELNFTDIPAADTFRIACPAPSTTPTRLQLCNNSLAKQSQTVSASGSASNCDNSMQRIDISQGLWCDKQSHALLTCVETNCLSGQACFHVAGAGCKKLGSTSRLPHPLDR